MARIHITGASGSGVSTLGAAVAATLDIPHVDTDDVFWMPTEPPYTVKRPEDERLALLSRSLVPGSDWVLSGSAMGWGAVLEPLYDLIVFLYLDLVVRMERIRQRERLRFGDRIEPGGDMAEISAAFLAWAARYDTAGDVQRSRLAHDNWLALQKAPVLRLDSALPVHELVRAVTTGL